jgi:tRNA threonylcarbamoyladenosine biosynthesis protein TsaE
MNFKIKSVKTINETARQFIEQIGNETVFAFNGTMGAGKTTFIKAICEELGVTEIVNSPTFSIVNEYEAADGRIIYHFDCYRINKMEEALEIGVEEYLYSGNLCFIEWSENIASLLPDSVINVEITEVENGERDVVINDDRQRTKDNRNKNNTTSNKNED